MLNQISCSFFQVLQGCCDCVLLGWQNTVCCPNLFCQYQPALWWLGLIQVKFTCGNHSDTTIISAIMLLYEQLVGCYKKCIVGRWVWTVWSDTFVDTYKTLSHGECLKISCETRKSEQKYYI